MRLLCIGLLCAACGDNGGGSGGAGGSGACGAPLTCDNFSGAPGYVAGTMSAIPANWPPPPSGTTLCGQTDKLVYYLTTQSGDAVFAYYQMKLPPLGYTLDAPSAGSQSCQRQIVLHKNGSLAGQIYVFDQRGGFSLLVTQ